MYLKLILFKFLKTNQHGHWYGNMDALCKCMFVIIETIVNRARRLDMFQRFFQRTCSCLLDSWKNKYQVPITSVFALSNLLTNLFTFSHTGQLTSSEHATCAFIIYHCICLPLCAHILFFDAAKFLIKLFILIYFNFTVSVIRHRNEYEIVTETWPIHNQISLPKC